MAEKNKCTANRLWCTFCLFFIKPIEELDFKDHITLVSSQITMRRALTFSIIALITSLLVLFLRGIDMFIKYEDILLTK